MPPEVSGIAIVCTLLFVEEAGLPLPVAPGEAVLIGAGLLVAGGTAPVWLIAPLAYLAVICGVLTGYTWRTASGLNGSTPLPPGCTPRDLTIEPRPGSAPPRRSRSRFRGCCPGFASTPPWSPEPVSLNLGRFMTGVLPASALWVITFMGLGIFAGAPVERLLGRFEAYGLRAAVVLAVVVVWVLAARRVPAGETSTTDEHGRGKWRLAAALGVDLAAVGCVTGALSLVAGLAPRDSEERAVVAAIFAILGIIYLVVARETVGFTLGEALLDARYQPRRRPRLHRAA